VDLCFGQQSPLSSLIYKDKYRVIPAFAGMEGTLMGSGVYRNQWHSFPGHPQSIDLSIHFPIYRWGSSAGILIGQDELGLERHSFIKPSFHKVLKLNGVLLSAGLQAEFNWINFNSGLARTPEGDYQGQNFDHNDPRLLNSESSLGTFDLGLSCYAIWGKFQGGISIEKLLQTKNESQPFPWANRRTIKAIGSKDFKWLDLDFKAQLLIYSDFVKVQADLFSGFDYHGSIFGGIHFRGYNGNSLESLGFSLGFSLSKSIQVAYCHEFYVGQIPVNYVTGNQEIGLFYNFGKAFGLGKPPRIIHSPRYSD
jgi:type IX secretion system PorP/SprF family membrane protein